MQSVLLVSKSADKRKEFLEKFAKEHGISQFDMNVTEPAEQSFGISDVRALQKTAYLAPNKGKEKMIVLEKAELLTTEAQNALLKMLEEPPQNTYIILSAKSNNNFLPTILSRCKTVALKQGGEEMSDEKRTELLNQLQLLTEGTISDRLAFAEKLAADKENLSQWFTESILLLREELLQNPDNKQILNLILAIQNSYKDFQTTNVSPRMILEHAFLSFRTE